MYYCLMLCCSQQAGHNPGEKNTFANTHVCNTAAGSRQYVMCVFFCQVARVVPVLGLGRLVCLLLHSC